jgi:hypothetical protein
VQETKLLNLQPHARTELQSIKEYFDIFECIPLSTIWIEILTLLQQTNLLIEARNATLDVDMKNMHNLISNIRQVREEWEKIFSKSMDIAGNARISMEFQTTHSAETQSDAENRHRINVFIVIVDSEISGLTRRFESLFEICNFFEILWTFEDLTDDEIKASAQKLQQKCAEEISNEICGKLIFM